MGWQVALVRDLQRAVGEMLARAWEEAWRPFGPSPSAKDVSSRRGAPGSWSREEQQQIRAEWKQLQAQGVTKMAFAKMKGTSYPTIKRILTGL